MRPVSWKWAITAWTFWVTVPVFGQSAPGAYASGGGQRGMYGGISTGQMVGVVNDPGFAGRLGATVSGLPQTTTRIPVQRVTGGWWGGRGRMNTVVVPFGVPMIWSGGSLGWGYDATLAAMPVQTVVQPAPVQPAPSVVINQYYSEPQGARPEMREYSNLPEPIRPPRSVGEPEPETVREPQPKPAPGSAPSPEASQPTITLLAFRNSSVVAVIAYWKQGELLHYVASNYEKGVAPLASLDVALTGQLNRERRVDFRLEEIR